MIDEVKARGGASALLVIDVLADGWDRDGVVDRIGHLIRGGAGSCVERRRTPGTLCNPRTRSRPGTWRSRPGTPWPVTSLPP